MKHAGVVCSILTAMTIWRCLSRSLPNAANACAARLVDLCVTAADVIQNRKKRRGSGEEEEQVGFTFIESRVCSTAS